MRVLLLFLLFLCSQIIAQEESTTEVSRELKNFEVRVLLDEQLYTDDTQEKKWILHSPTGFILTDIYNPELTEELSTPELSIIVKKNGIFINNKRLKRDAIKIASKSPETKFGSNNYNGTFIIIKTLDKAFLINSVALEDYVFSVLRWESWPGWPHEVNKAFAITYRTYVIAKVLEARHNKKLAHKRLLFDIRCTNAHQTYKGTHNFHHVRQAVDETAGIIMTYNQQPILAMYDSCCGGIIPAKTKAANFIKAPYLARDYACNYCKKCKLYSWRATYDLSLFKEILTHEIGAFGKIHDITVKKYAKNGSVEKVIIHADGETYTLTAKKIYSLFKDVKSYSFAITLVPNKKKVRFEGLGFGHHCGLCQWGARQMIEEGADFKKVLNFYYPKVKLTRIEVS